MCPIGQPEFKSKHPGVIAVGVAADLIYKNELLRENSILLGLRA
jgi:xanthine/CO dehydrogenase XdhC/CoxF family maturation factor